MTTTKIALLSGILVSSALAQPPEIIRIVRNGAIQPYLEAKAPVNVVGMSSISGISENWLVELHDSFGSLEDLEKALSVTPHAPAFFRPPDNVPSRSLIAAYRPGLSYRPDQAIQYFPKSRFFDVTIYHIRPGTEVDFGNYLKLRGSRMDSINLDRPDIAYQIMSGERAGTYVVLTPLPSLRVLDDGKANTPAYAEGDQGAAKQLVATTELVRERLWFRVEPRLSFVSDEFAAGDTGFWHPAPN